MKLKKNLKKKSFKLFATKYLPKIKPKDIF